MWCDRIAFESYTSQNASSFLTLTFDEAHMPENRSASKKVMSDFFKRLRYYSNEHFRYFYSSEYGDLHFRLHYHVCMLNFDANSLRNIEDVSKAWADKSGYRFGIFTLTPLSTGRIRYTVEYISYENPLMNKVYKSIGLSPCVHSCSKSIGADWIYSHADMIRETNGYFSNGVLRPLPRYFQEKLGLKQKYEYLDRLSDIWKPYNDILQSHNCPLIDPFNVHEICKNGYLDVITPEQKRAKRVVLNSFIDRAASDRAQAHKSILDIEKSTTQVYSLDIYNATH